MLKIDHQIRVRVSFDTGSIWSPSAQRFRAMEIAKRAARPLVCHDLSRSDVSVL
jgi:hypothetical protein